MQEEIKAKQSKRVDYLIEVYKLNDLHPRATIDGNKVASNLNLVNGEIKSIIKYLSERGLLNVKYGTTRLEITSQGVDYVENHFLTQQKKQMDPLFDELLEKIEKLEMGQKITYDDLHTEIQELKDLIGKLSEKNIGEILIGKLVKLGGGKLADELIDAIKDTFTSQNLLPH
ncbi:MAG: hypothetical protein Tsb0034_20910 [Ekhidna sp.]